MKSIVLFIVVSLSLPALADDRADIAALLQTFLSAAHLKSAHQRFWAEELVYTSSAGERFGKADILAGFAEAEEPAPDTVYRGDQVDIRLYGDTAVVAFRLLGENAQQKTTQYYFNTGTLVKRQDRWQVVAWQATKANSE